MLGAILGIAFGCIQLYLLMLAGNAIAGGTVKIWPLVAQFFCPFLGLGLCAFILRHQLIPCAVAMVVVLISGALARFIIVRRRKKD